MQDRALLADLDAEQQSLDDLLASLDDTDWAAPTPAAGWTVHDTVAHLALAELLAHASVVDERDPVGSGPFPFQAPAAPAALLDSWRSARHATLAAFAARDDRDRVPWGGRRMAVRSLATARLMETWAHGLDCFAAVGRAPVDTDRLVHVARLGWRSLPVAFAVAGESPPAPPEELRVELRAPSGARWEFGPDAGEAAARVRGDASVWCRVVTHRWRAPEPAPLECAGDLATAAVRVARAFL
jgi:uncharacterized protein (TIGR03084 family)